MSFIDFCYSHSIKALKNKEKLCVALRNLFEGGNYSHSHLLLDHADGYVLTEVNSSRILASNMFIVAFPYGFNPENNQQIFSGLKEKNIIHDNYNLYQMETCYRHPKRELNATFIMIYPNHLDPIKLMCVWPPILFEYNTAKKRVNVLPDEEIKIYERCIKIARLQPNIIDGTRIQEEIKSVEEEEEEEEKIKKP